MLHAVRPSHITQFFAIHNALFMGNAKFMDRQIKKYNYKFTSTSDRSLYGSYAIL